ncbi:orotidine-5'-phosphate decarboxylase [Nakamurella sp. UYEF19]|uniref:orotidine-5'-phosphate decarboxylase n=1 Tax=Nakamurella sp. UYEF19 TaxID=1756392 RepID=UPI0033994049
MQSFGSKLADAMAVRGPLCVGIDPHPGLLRSWDLPQTVAGLEKFAMTTVEALAPMVAVLKPQSAFFEAYGSAGVAVLERLIAQARSAGALVLLDAKRGDIGSTMTAYAQAYLTEGSPLAADAVTLSPFLGFGSLRPALDAAKASGRGVFVLALTSNPEGPALQHAVTDDGRSVAQSIVDAAAQENSGESPLGSIGLVVGATIGRTGVDLTKANGPFLAPGIGAQGATIADLKVVFGDDLSAVLATTSREVLGAGPSLTGLRDAAARLTDDLRAALTG